MFSVINRSTRRELNHILKEISFCIKLRHVKSLDDKRRFSDIFHHIFTNTKQTSPSVSIVSLVVAHTKKSNCWINSQLISYRNYHQCSRRCCISPNLNKEFNRFISIEHNKMVWISDLDNYQVNSRKIFSPSWKKSIEKIVTNSKIRLWPSEVPLYLDILIIFCVF